MAHGVEHDRRMVLRRADVELGVAGVAVRVWSASAAFQSYWPKCGWESETSIPTSSAARRISAKLTCAPGSQP